MSEQKLLIKLDGTLPVTVYFDYQPEERETQTYPGCAAGVELNSVHYKDYEDIMPLLNKSTLSELADKCMESMDIFNTP